MPRSRLIASLIAATIVGALLLLVPARAVSQELSHVVVTNWPETQAVEGTVAIDGAVRLSEQVTIREIIVPPVRRNDTTRLVSAGTLTTDGFPNVVLSLHGQVKGSVHQQGRVGAILIPQEQTIQDAFNELGLMHFALEVVAADVSAATPFFASSQPRYTVGFQRYDVLLYNTTDKTVTANLFAYLTN